MFKWHIYCIYTHNVQSPENALKTRVYLLLVYKTVGKVQEEKEPGMVGN